ncbi:MAG TPA: ATP synthase F1 subunit delta [Ktedonobacterales bacterium]|nr:ATP synthase F1 subunit delta [Ktedonobacterales bacterium]
MLKGAVARRYAEAVFDLGVQQGTLDRWQSDLHLIAEAFGNRKLSFILRQPRIPFARKEVIVRDLLEKRVTREALGLAVLLVERELVDLGPSVAEAFDQKLNDHRNQANAVVTTAVPLAASQQAEVTSYLQALTGKTISLETRVDPEILGGLVAQIGDTLIDGSVRRRLALLRDQIIRGGGGGPDDGATLAALGNGQPPGGAQPSKQPGKGNQPKR